MEGGIKCNSCGRCKHCHGISSCTTLCNQLLPIYIDMIEHYRCVHNQLFESNTRFNIAHWRIQKNSRLAHSFMQVFFAVELLLVLIAAAECIRLVPTSGSSWLRAESSVDDQRSSTTSSSRSNFGASSRSTDNICRLRGGADSDDSNKITGTCIGIDLGTTYRYASALPTTPLNVNYSLLYVVR